MVGLGGAAIAHCTQGQPQTNTTRQRCSKCTVGIQNVVHVTCIALQTCSSPLLPLNLGRALCEKT